jgi:hypothetical protein
MSDLTDRLKDNGCVDDDLLAVARELDRLTAERDALREQYESACKLVADMHAAAMGGNFGPALGVVEDVSALRERVAVLEQDAARLYSIYLGVTNDGYGWWLPEWCVKVGETAPTIDNFKAQIDTERAAIDAALKGER